MKWHAFWFESPAAPTGSEAMRGRFSVHENPYLDTKIIFQWHHYMYLLAIILNLYIFGTSVCELEIQVYEMEIWEYDLEIQVYENAPPKGGGPARESNAIFRPRKIRNGRTSKLGGVVCDALSF